MTRQLVRENKEEKNMYNQSQNEVQNPPTGAYILSLLGGIFALIGSLALIVMGAFVGVFTFGLGFVVIGGLGIWIMICSIIVIVAASKLKAEPMEHSKWGALILVFSLIGAWSILDFIGGILALVYKPITYGAAPPQYGQPYAAPQPQVSYGSVTRICPQCGRVVQDNLKFCPNCGKQLN
jgi:hypothetical protein